MKNKNILELCLSDGLGGLEMFSVQCYKAFREYTNSQIAVNPKGKLASYLEDEDIFFLKRRKFFAFVPALKLAKYIDSNAIDIIHFHWTRDILTVVLGRLLSKRKPKIVQSRHMTMTRFKDDFYHRWLYKNIDMIHAVTDKVKSEVHKYVPEDICPQVQRVYLGVEIPSLETKKVEDLKKKHGLQNCFVVGIVGRIEENKGQYKLIEALDTLASDVKLCIVGSAMQESYLKKLQSRVKELGLSNRVVFTGFTKKVHLYMQLFDVNVLATHNETFGLVVIETMANKTAMLARDKGGPLEIIEDGVDGLFFDGSVEDLQEKIHLLYEEKELKEKMQEQGFLKVKRKFYASIQFEVLYTALLRL